MAQLMVRNLDEILQSALRGPRRRPLADVPHPEHPLPPIARDMRRTRFILFAI